jgi:hypothetical protein
MQMNSLLINQQNHSHNFSQEQQIFTSFTEFYDRYAPSFYGEIKRQLYGQEICNAVLITSFQQIWENRSQFDINKESLFIWCYGIVRKHIRKKKVDLLLKELFTCQNYAPKVAVSH